MSATRSSEEIRASIEANRAALGLAVQRLQGEVTKATDWRAQLDERRNPVLIGVVVAGFVIGGGIAGITGIFSSDDDED